MYFENRGILNYGCLQYNIFCYLERASIMIEKKYQVFISSTYTDLIEARAKVRDAILSMYHFPVGMELFGAANEEQWQIISETIESSDYYVLILGQRYGSVILEGPDAGISYTEKEFRYAIKQGIPILAFLLDESVPVKPENIEKDHPNKLKEFKKRVKTGRLVEWWKTPDDLAQKVTIALYKQITRTKRPGWTRGDLVDVGKSLNTITELTEENRRLIARCEQLEEINKCRNFLETLVCDGKKYLENNAIITFDINSYKYKLSFQKRYIIISDAIKWYEGQFYCNNNLSNAETSREFYKTHPVEWDSLHIYAELRYKNVEEEDFSRKYPVTIQRVAEGNNYKKFHIQYRTITGDKLNIKQGAEVILNYSYEVPVLLWGSYINRYISYWGETATVTFMYYGHNIRYEKNLFKVFETDNHNGEKYLCEDASTLVDYSLNGWTITFSLPQKPASLYSIWWDATKILSSNVENTTMVADLSQLTRY